MRNTALLLSFLVLLGSACSDGADESAVADELVVDENTNAVAGTVRESDEAEKQPDEGSEPAEELIVGIDFELFSIDEGAGCAVYVSVPEAEVDAAGDLRVLIWQGVVASGFEECGFSDVIEVGLLTVNGLDSYDQPDFSATISHVYYGVDGWEALVADCYSLALTDACVDRLAASFLD